MAQTGSYADPVLLGRDHELQVIADLVAQLPQGGGVLHVTGPAGIGKSSLVAAAAAAAERKGMVVLGCRGALAESHLPFAALHQLLRPLLPGLPRLPPAHRAALGGAFGLTKASSVGDGSTTDRFFIALAALELIANVAASQPVLVVADDVHWFDAPSRDVIDFLARRVASEPVALLLTTRADSGEGDAVDPSMPLLTLSPLDAVTAGQVLYQRAPTLTADARALVLEQAEGNPLALVELPLGFEIAGPALLGARSLPLTLRLEQAFASRLGGLPALTRTLLLVAALQDREDLASITVATSALVGESVATTAVDPALALALISIDGEQIRFRHPLVRSAVIQSATDLERQAVHRALAALPEVDPNRRAWHRAAAASAPDEAVASALQEAADLSKTRGAPRAAQLWFERAAQLSTDEAHQGHRLLRAAEIAFELGQGDSVHALLDRARPLGLELSDQARLAGLEVAFAGQPGGQVEVRRLVAGAEQVLSAGDDELAARLLMGAAHHCYRSSADDELWAAVRATTDRVGLPHTDPQMILLAAFLDPFARNSGFLDQFKAIADGPTIDGAAASLLALAAFVAADFDHALTFANRAATLLRQQGRVDLLVQAHVMRSFTGLYLGRWDVTFEASAAAHELAIETRQSIWAACALLGQADLAGLRGDETRALGLAQEVERAALLSGTTALLSHVQLMRGITALGVDQPSRAFDEFRRMVTASDPAYQLPQATWAIDYLAEAAARAGRADEAREVLRDLAGLLDRSPAPGLRRAAALAAAVLADDASAEQAFQEAYALSTAASAWYRARLDLAHGAWLRRHQRVAESRPALRAAKAVFDALGAPAWSARASRELTASGERSEPAAPTGWARLSAQELQIARLAAVGLSNQDIAERLYLSHRTVASHLYRLFPKLGVRSRTQLHLALPAVE